MTSCEEASVRQRDIQRLLQALCTVFGINIDMIGLELKL